ncbi:MAG: bifunctional pyr operon transcriptional regulator/uracil phosphoribosyltransferase PyrR [Proteobacteria bacterium]|nr:bifunctional pyr operon transcriptional regulator/uracil phosphoribosyltransferase PyrR [Pseudomonadota bacterium]MBU1740223.1 bifunctional pyr operon transcriptional regulator/uracil phosphoribosyltransferase PyrR [Pseudomonadota bacterium]
MSPEYQTVVLDGPALGEKLADLADEMVGRHADAGALALVGIRTGGAHLAFRLRELIGRRTGRAPDTGVVDISLYRDDWTRINSKPLVGPTDISFPLDDKEVILVDDVLFTGRTVRAALDQLIDFGRPRRIELCVLVDRGHRELPIAPDYVGLTVNTDYGQQVEVFLEEKGSPDRIVLLS